MLGCVLLMAGAGVMRHRAHLIAPGAKLCDARCPLRCLDMLVQGKTMQARQPCQQIFRSSNRLRWGFTTPAPLP